MTRPEIIAHRGASRERPENTIAAFERAAELGADGCEFDVHRHPDGILRIHHDPLPIGSPLPPGVPTLEEVLTVHAARGMVAYAELKGPGSTRGTTAALAQLGLPAAVHSFDHRMIAEARRIAPDIPRGVLEVSYPIDHLHALQDVGGRDLWRQWPFVDAELVQAATAAGCRVIAWTVNAAAEMERLAALGVHGICTDDVALARRILGA